MKIQAIARLLEQAAAVPDLNALSKAAAAEAVKGKKNQSWTKNLFKITLKRPPTEDELDKCGIIIFNDIDDVTKKLSIDWTFADGFAGLNFGDDAGAELEGTDIEDFEDPKKLEKYLKKMESAVTKLIAIVNK